VNPDEYVPWQPPTCATCGERPARENRLGPPLCQECADKAVAERQAAIVEREQEDARVYALHLKTLREQQRRALP